MDSDDASHELHAVPELKDKEDFKMPGTSSSSSYHAPDGNLSQ